MFAIEGNCCSAGYCLKLLLLQSEGGDNRGISSLTEAAPEFTSQHRYTSQFQIPRFSNLASHNEFHLQ